MTVTKRMYAPAKKQDSGDVKACALMFSVLFPENRNFSCSLSASAAHLIIRAMGHLKGYVVNTFPSTSQGVAQPFDVKVSG